MTARRSSDPATADQYAAAFALNMRVEGYGLETAQVLPCPFCAAPDWKRVPVADTEAALAEEARCESCGRAAKGIMSPLPGGGVTLELVQTAGPAPPPYMVPPPRRVKSGGRR